MLTCSHHPISSPSPLLLLLLPSLWPANAKNSSSPGSCVHCIDRQVSSLVAMMAMSYFRAPRRLYGRKQQKRESAALLVDEDGGDDQGEAAAAAGAVPKGYFAVYVGAESRRYLSEPAFRELMERAAEEFGFDQAGGLRIPCREEDFQATVAALEQSRRRGAGWARGSAAGTTRWARAS
ncbi:hypothetical protein BDA96_06G021100 [Sorghum bicolor]|uniref:Uncharacterized protein n=1 Tax=Sorghum bicolor TaxID=4558 RepID=A0A921QMZ0_SORBI|nr:hypothetical protein BDA96_06G021100 [Sorghum bicolor]